MNTVILDRIQPLDGLPPSLRGNALAYYDLRSMPSVFLPLTNLVTNGDFSNGTTGWTPITATRTAASNTLSITGNGAGASAYAYQNTATNIVTGNVIYIRAVMRVTNANCTWIALRIGGSGGGASDITVNTPASGTWYTKSANATMTGAFSGSVQALFYHTYADAATANGKTMEVQYVLALDLTALFGAGNEPTAAEMDAMLLNYSATSWFNGTASICINPAGRYYLPDTSGNGQHLHLLNMAYSAASGPQLVSPPYLKCDGTDDYGRRKLASSIASGSAVSLSCWYRSVDVSQTRWIFRITDMTNYMAIYYTAGNMLGYIHDGTGANFFAVAMTADYNNTWNHLVLVYDPATKKCTGYRNGIYVGISGALTNQLVACTDAILSNTQALTSYTLGDHGDIAIFNKTLIADEVKLLYNRRAMAYGRNRI